MGSGGKSIRIWGYDPAILKSGALVEEASVALKFDVFLPHNSRDKSTARKLKAALLKVGLTVWLDADELQPGIPWQALLETGIRSSMSVAVLLSDSSLGPWESEEVDAALRIAVRHDKPVVPVLLPGASKEQKLPIFLGSRTYVDLTHGLNESGLAQLQWGITGKKPV